MKQSFSVDILKPRQNELKVAKEEIISGPYKPKSRLDSRSSQRDKIRYNNEDDDEYNYFPPKSANKKLIFRKTNPYNSDDRKISYQPYATTYSNDFNKSQQENQKSLNHNNRADIETQQFKQQLLSKKLIHPSYSFTPQSQSVQSNNFMLNKPTTPNLQINRKISNRVQTSNPYKRRDNQQLMQIQNDHEVQHHYSEQANIHQDQNQNTQENNLQQNQNSEPQKQQQQTQQQDSIQTSYKNQVAPQQNQFQQLDQQQQFQNTQQQHYQPSEKCFSQNEQLDPALFDSISTSELAQIVPESILNNKNVDLNKLIEDNTEYFYHLAGQCACRKCSCGLCKCDINSVKLKYLSGLTSTYGKDFYKKDKTYRAPVITDKMLGTKFGPWQQLDKNYTTLKDDFQNPGAHQPVPKYQHKYQYIEKPNQKLTSYNSNFAHWGDYDIHHYKTPIHKSTNDNIPFFGKTNYQESFGNFLKKGDLIPNGLSKKKAESIPQHIPFLGETTQMKDFQSYKIVPKPNYQQKHLKENEEAATYAQIPSYEGQFTSTMTKDFSKNRNDFCSLKTTKHLFRKRLIKKLDELRSEKQRKELQLLSN